MLEYFIRRATLLKESPKMLLNYQGYVGYVEFDENEKIYSGRVINLEKDVVTFWGETIEQARKELEISINSYLEFCQRKMRSPENPVV